MPAEALANAGTRQLMPTAYRLLKTDSYLPPTANRFLPTAFRLPLTQQRQKRQPFRILVGSFSTYANTSIAPIVNVLVHDRPRFQQCATVGDLSRRGQYDGNSRLVSGER